MVQIRSAVVAAQSVHRWCNMICAKLVSSGRRITGGLFNSCRLGSRFVSFQHLCWCVSRILELRHE